MGTNNYQIQSIKVKSLDSTIEKEISYDNFMEMVVSEKTTLDKKLPLKETFGENTHYWESSWLDQTKTTYLSIEEQSLNNGEVIVQLNHGSYGSHDIEELGRFQYDETMWNWIVDEWCGYLKCNMYYDSIDKTMKEIELHNFKKELDKKYGK